MTASVTRSLGVVPQHRIPLRTRIFGRQPIGMLLTAPYVIFIGVVFAFPLGFAVWMSFHDYFFTAPGPALYAARANTRDSKLLPLPL